MLYRSIFKLNLIFAWDWSEPKWPCAFEIGRRWLIGHWLKRAWRFFLLVRRLTQWCCPIVLLWRRHTCSRLGPPGLFFLALVMLVGNGHSLLQRANCFASSP